MENGSKGNIRHQLVTRLYDSRNLISGQGLGRSLVRLEIKHGYMKKNCYKLHAINDYRLKS